MLREFNRYYGMSSDEMKKHADRMMAMAIKDNIGWYLIADDLAEMKRAQDKWGEDANRAAGIQS